MFEAVLRDFIHGRLTVGKPVEFPTLFPHSKEKICKILLRYAGRAWKHENAQILENTAFLGKIEQKMEVEKHD